LRLSKVDVLQSSGQVDSSRIGTRRWAAISLSEHRSPEALIELHKFHVKGDKSDPEAEARAARKFSEAFAM
jgi:hypothetical protein